MTIRKHMLAAAIASTLMGLTACGGGSNGTQDVGNNGNQVTSRAFYARAVDGYLAGATVYVDQNENNQLDAFEPRALTDIDGYFSYNHSTGTDYCATGGLSQHCLRGNIAANAEVLIRVTGGYDTVTKLPFKGVLSLRSSELDRDDLRLVTPVTSMVAETASGSDAQSKLQALIDAGVLQPGGSLNDDLTGQIEMTRAQAAAIISRLVGEAGHQTYPATFQDVEGAGWAAAYVAMAAQLVEGVPQGATFDTTFSSVESIRDLARRSIYAATHAGQTMPESFELPNSSNLEALFQSAADIVGLNAEMIAALHGAAPTPDEVKAMLRVQSVLAERVLVNPTDPELLDLTDWVRNQVAQGNGLGSDLTALGGDNIDLSALIDAGFDFDPISNSISASATIPADAANTFAALVNTSFGLSIHEPDEQGAAVVFVSGDASARSGEIDVCVRYRGDEDFDTTSSSDPNGAMLIGGRWSLLDDHTLTLNIDVVGGVRSLLLKAVNASGADRDYRFDFGDDLSAWSGSAPAAFASGSAPATDAACKAALIERFGPMNPS